MNSKPLSVLEFVEKVKSGEVSITGHLEKIVSEVEANSSLNLFTFFDRDFVFEQAMVLESRLKKNDVEGLSLLGVPVSVKDCVCVKGLESKAGSKMLSGYKPVFDATVIKKVKAAGAIILGKTSQDEFGFGTFSVNHTAGGVPLNPLDNSRSCGGSSGGSAGFTALTSNTHVSIAESTGGSIACPASFCGVSSITPTYGIVSRFGLIDYANSLDKIGVMGKSINDAALLLNVMVGKDPNDSTSIDFDGSLVESDFSFEGVSVGLPKELFDSVQNESVKRIVLSKIKKIEDAGASVVEVSLPLNVKYGLADYYLIAMAEASTNLAKYCGMRYGFQSNPSGLLFNDYFSKVRSSVFGKEAKRRILLGTFARMSGFRDAYYVKAMKVRSLLIKEFKSVLSKVDFVANPAMPIVAPKFSEIEKLSPLEVYSMDLCTVPANLCGLPHSTINAGFVSGLPIGLMFTSDHLRDADLVSFSSAVEGLR